MKTILLSIIICLSTCISLAQTESKIEVLTVEVFGTYEWQGKNQHGIYIYRPGNAEPERIEFESCPTFEKCLLRNSPVVRQKIEEILNDGWQLLDSSGGDTFIRYIFTKDA